MRQILCADGDVDFCHYLESFLLDSDTIVHSSHNLADAKKRITQSKVDYLIIDESFPDGSGIDFIKWVREKFGSQLDITFVTSLHSSAHDLRYFKNQLQINLVLEKPLGHHETKTFTKFIAKGLKPTRKGISTKLPPKLLHSYRNGIYDKLEELENEIHRVHLKRNPKELYQLKFIIDKISGSAGSYGYEHVGRLCREFIGHFIRNLKSPSGKLDNACICALNEFFRKLKVYFQMEGSVDFPPFTPLPITDKSFVFIATHLMGFWQLFQEHNHFAHIVMESDPTKVMNLLAIPEFQPEVIWIDEHYFQTLNFNNRFLDLCLKKHPTPEVILHLLSNSPPPPGVAQVIKGPLTTEKVKNILHSFLFLT